MDLFGDEPAIDEPEEAEDEAPPAATGSLPADLCLGQDEAEKRLLAFYESGQIPHSLVFTGPKGIGKAAMAVRFAKFLLKHGTGDAAQDALFESAPPVFKSLDIPPDDPVARRVAAGGHSDLKLIERPMDPVKNRQKDIIDVGEIRKIPAFIRMTAGEGGWRVVIVDDADTMNRNAQNALLKILEEPPADSLLILVAHRMGALIPTIRSRVQIVPFRPLSPAVIAELLAARGVTVSGPEAEILARLAGGSIGKALELAEGEGLETFGKTLAALESYPSWDWPALHRLADDFGGAGREGAFRAFQEALQWIFRSLAAARARGREIPDAPLLDSLPQSLVGNSSLESLLKICENLQSHFDKANAANLDRRQAVLGAFSLIAS